MNKQLYLIDGSGYIYRAYHGIRDLATTSGFRTNAVYGFTTMLLRLLREEKPEHVAVVFDPPRGETFRSKLYAEYKANRKEMPEDLVPQIPYIRKIVGELGIPSLEVRGFEADDVIATVAHRYADEGIDVTVVTGDKDLMQIVGERISLLDTMKEKRWGIAEVQERFGVGPGKVVDVLGLAGDTSDNIPGVPGIGEKSAMKLVQVFGSLEGVLEWTDLVSGKTRRKNLRTYADQARLSKELATVRRDVPLEAPLGALTPSSYGPELLPLLRELEFRHLETYFTPPEPGVVEIYSDGSGNEQGPGGYGVVLRYGTSEKKLSGFELKTTSQRMELLGAICGLEALTKHCKVRLVSDSQYLIRGMTEWMPGWIRGGRLDEPGALKNQDLWIRLNAAAARHSVHWEWVRGHNGHPFNEQADVLARKASLQARRILSPQEQPSAQVAETPIHSPPAQTSPPVMVEQPCAPPGVPSAQKEIEAFESEEDGQLAFF
jgi:ribonuclease HI